MRVMMFSSPLCLLEEPESSLCHFSRPSLCFTKIVICVIWSFYVCINVFTLSKGLPSVNPLIFSTGNFEALSLFIVFPLSPLFDS